MTDLTWVKAAIAAATEVVVLRQHLGPDDPTRLHAERRLRELKLLMSDQRDADADPGDRP